jgi:hydroxymethylbilane synthase
MHVCQLLQKALTDVRCEVHDFVTSGDRTLDKPLAEIGGKGLFTQELESAIREGRIDFAVHSLKDLPVEEPDGVTLGAIVGRADVRDVLVAAENRSLDTLPPGAVIGTSSPRRRSQQLHYRPDLSVRSIRGNVDTRIRKANEGEYDGAILASAGLVRLGLEAHITQWLSLDLMLPAPGQGAIAVQCRSDDEETLQALSAINDWRVRTAVTAERRFLYSLGGGCSAPIAAYATLEANELHLDGLVATPDGDRLIRVDLQGPSDEPLALGERLAELALENGAQELLDDG